MITDLVFLDGNSVEEIMSCFDSSIGLWYTAKNIDMIALAQLGEMLQVGDYESLSAGFDLVSEPNEQMLFSFPSKLKAKLATLADNEISEVSEKWKNIEEFRGGMSSEACIKYLSEVRDFLNKSDEPVYLQMGA